MYYSTPQNLLMMFMNVIPTMNPIRTTNSTKSIADHDSTPTIESILELPLSKVNSITPMMIPGIITKVDGFQWVLSRFIILVTIGEATITSPDSSLITAL